MRPNRSRAGREAEEIALAVDAMTIGAMLASLAGRFSGSAGGLALKLASQQSTNIHWEKEYMPRGRSTFTKRQKEQTRQQRQRDKAERRSQRKQEKAVVGNADELAELREHAAEQAALFNVGAEDADTAERTASGDQVGE